MNFQTVTAYALNVSSDTKYPAFSADAWMKAAEVTLMGLGAVFAVLAVLWLVLSIFKLIFVKDTATKSKTEEKKTAAPEPKPEPVAVAEKTDDGELIAVITAAIAAYRASEEGLTGDDVNGFKVVSFKRATKGRAWNSNK